MRKHSTTSASLGCASSLEWMCTMPRAVASHESTCTLPALRAWDNLPPVARGLCRADAATRQRRRRYSRCLILTNSRSTVQRSQIPMSSSCRSTHRADMENVTTKIACPSPKQSSKSCGSSSTAKIPCGSLCRPITPITSLEVSRRKPSLSANAR